MNSYSKVSKQSSQNQANAHPYRIALKNIQVVINLIPELLPFFLLLLFKIGFWIFKAYSDFLADFPVRVSLRGLLFTIV